MVTGCQSETNTIGPVQHKLVILTNKFREENGVSLLVEDKELCRQAQEYAVWMRDNGQFKHSRGVSENIGFGQETPEDVIKDWAKSPGHKLNMLNPKHTKIGTGYAKGKRCWWVQQFQ